MLHRVRSRDSSLKTPRPVPTYMTNAQKADYLADLRSLRVTRPSGSRPLPALDTAAEPQPFVPSIRAPSPALSNFHAAYGPYSAEPEDDTGPHRRTHSAMSGSSMTASIRDQAIVQRPHQEVQRRTISGSGKGSDFSLRSTYVESEHRWREREEARFLREALEDMDLREEARLQAAAQQEASELVWRHQNPDAPRHHPHAPFRYTPHLQKEDHARSQSVGRGALENDIISDEEVLQDGISQLRGVEDNDVGVSNPRGSSDYYRAKPPCADDRTRKVHQIWDSPQKKAYMNLTFSRPPPDPSNRRRSSGPKARNFSGSSAKGPFANPDDQIYEEPEEQPSQALLISNESSPMPAPLQPKLRSPQAVRRTRDPPARANTAPLLSAGKSGMQDILKHPVSQSRNPAYLTNPLPPTPPGSGSDGDVRHAPDGYSTKDGVEVRGDEIRQATSMRRRERSPKLPSPSFVSAAPGRPIVSFDRDWKAKDAARPQDASLGRDRYLTKELPPNPAPYQPRGKGGVRGHTSSAVPVPSMRVPTTGASPGASRPAPAVPTVNVPTINVPTINVPTINVPIINLPDDPPATSDPPAIPTIVAPSLPSAPLPEDRPLPSAQGGSTRPAPRRSHKAPATTAARHQSLATARVSAACTQCQLPIAGRIVSAAGQRFHPECFICFHCGEGLECVAFYPEPESSREDRVDRIRKRACGEHVEEVEGRGELEDGDEALRFYCHLDFHEFFSPRCRSCKTPIEGEVVVACGGEWHVGHFFCAECGDPFDPSTPFVEKDGYAWCVNCHTNRYSTKCKKCRKPVTDQVVTALGAEWHAECFCCVECHGDFDDGRYFLRGDEEEPVCVRCEERRLKA